MADEVPYNASQIKTFDGESVEIIQHIRKRPGMYCGGCTEYGLRHLWDDFVSTELAATDANLTNVEFTLEEGGFLSLTLTGKISGIEPAQRFFPFVNAYPEPPQNSLAILAAMSERVEIEIVQRSGSWRQVLERGLVTSGPEHLTCDDAEYARIRFRPDRTLFPPHVSANFHRNCGRMRQRAIFNPTVIFRVRETSSGNMQQFHYPAGLRDYVEEMEYEWIGQVSLGVVVYSAAITDGHDRAEVIIVDRGVGPGILQTFVNGERAMEGGDPVTGLKRGLKLANRKFPDWYNTPRELKSRDILAGQTIVLALWVQEPQWAGATKDRLIGPKFASLVYRMIVDQLPEQRRRWNEAVEAARKAGGFLGHWPYQPVD
jgi:DNA gyrase/topoisomerase IV subunit B